MRQTPTGKIAFWGSLWGFGVLILSVVLDPSPENLTLGLSITLSGLYTWLLYLTKDHWIKRLRFKPVRNAILVGSLNAAVIETIFLLAEKVFGASGVAAHPNLLIDLIMTMPWYIAMVWIFVHVQKTERFSGAGVLLLGAVYEMGADGLVGGLIIPGIVGEPVNILEFTFLAILIAFWQFIPVYSSMVLPPAWILDAGIPEEHQGDKCWRRGLKPLLTLVPFLVYLILFMTLFNSMG